MHLNPACQRQQHHRGGDLTGQQRPACECCRDEQRRGERRFPARHGAHLRVDHRGGEDGGERQRRAEPAERGEARLPEHQPRAIGGHDQQGRHRADPLARQPARAPLAERLPSAFGVAEVKGRGHEAPRCQRVGHGEEGEGHPAGDSGQAEAEPDEQAEACAGEGGEGDDGRGGVHVRALSMRGRASRESPSAPRPRGRAAGPARPPRRACLAGAAADTC